MLWAYRTTYKRATNQTPFKLFYGQEAIVRLHFRQNTPEIVHILKIDTIDLRDERMFQLQKQEEDRILAIHH